MAFALPALAIAGAATSAFGAVMGGESQAASAQYQSQVAANNAKVANQNAQHAAEAGEQQAGQASQKTAAQLGGIKTAIAANGLDVNSGSSVDVEKSARETGKLNTETVLNNAQDQVYGYRATAVSDQAQSGLDKMAAEEDPIGADIGAAGSLFGNAAAIGSKNWNSGNLTSLFSGG